MEGATAHAARPMRRVMIIGSGGAGKSTLAARMGARTGLPVVHLDAEHWKPGWVETPEAEWARVVDALVARDSWVIDGNYGGTLDQRFAAADTVIFLDMPRAACLWGVIKRRVRFRGRTRPDVGRGCPERLTWEFIRWIWTYRATRRPGILKRLESLAREKRVVRLTTRAEVEAFVTELAPATRAGHSS
ncbi:MAG: DNA topology modulation protein [Gemmatimonadaceae bacterium]